MTPTVHKSGYQAPAAAAGEFRTARVAVLATRWNREVLQALQTGADEALREAGIEAVETLYAPGAYELPLAAELAARSGRYDAVVALGCVIRGDTPHFDYVAGECARGLMEVQLRHGLPVAFGVLTVNTDAQAAERCRPGRENKGYEAVQAALEMLRLRRHLLLPRI
ncbi:MAG TPA: 6,7-dimethyl-8-ribityllumazine synthase [Nevskiaceae bacterium]|nr:6,7-dimethyl-8-ribityllumazine synthase [Nevskiaceae bacterium]